MNQIGESKIQTTRGLRTIDEIIKHNLAYRSAGICFHIDESILVVDNKLQELAPFDYDYCLRTPLLQEENPSQAITRLLKESGISRMIERFPIGEFVERYERNSDTCYEHLHLISSIIYGRRERHIKSALNKQGFAQAKELSDISSSFESRSIRLNNDALLRCMVAALPY